MRMGAKIVLIVFFASILAAAVAAQETSPPSPLTVVNTRVWQQGDSTTRLSRLRTMLAGCDADKNVDDEKAKLYIAAGDYEQVKRDVASYCNEKKGPIALFIFSKDDKTVRTSEPGKDDPPEKNKIPAAPKGYRVQVVDQAALQKRSLSRQIVCFGKESGSWVYHTYPDGTIGGGRC